MQAILLRPMLHHSEKHNRSKSLFNGGIIIPSAHLQSRRDVVVLLRASEQKVWSSKLDRNTTGIRQEVYPEFKVLRCSSKKSGSKASV